MQFDIFTILTASCSVILVSALIILMYWSRNRSAGWLMWWGAGFGILGLANIIVMARPALPDYISAGAGTSLLLLGFGMLWQAARKFEGRRPVFWPIGAAILIWLVLFFIPPIRENLVARIAISSVPMSGALFLTAFELWRGRAEELDSRMPVIGVVCAMALIFAARIPLAPFAPYPMGGNPMEPLTVTAFNIALFIGAITMTVQLISMTMERAELAQRELAMSDPLTGLPNRRAFDAQFKGASIAGQIAVIALDLDHFKHINDNFGHAAGDRVLLEFTRICRESIRQVDLAVRIGGEEFAIILPGTDTAKAKKVAERIRAELAVTVIGLEIGAVACTVSAGIATTGTGPGATLDELLALADAEMYRAKRAGRNRVMVHRQKLAA